MALTLALQAKMIAHTSASMTGAGVVEVSAGGLLGLALDSAGGFLGLEGPSAVGLSAAMFTHNVRWRSVFGGGRMRAFIKAPRSWIGESARDKRRGASGHTAGALLGTTIPIPA